MKPRFLLLFLVFAALPLLAQRDADKGWRTVGVTKGVTVSTRKVPDSAVDEVRAVGQIDAPPATVLAVLADVDAYEQTMPYTVESRLLKREGNEVWAYSVVDPPLASPRDYCVKITLLRLPDDAFGTKWVPANEMAPPLREGVVRVEKNSGSWTLEPTNGGVSTYATYRLHTDPGGKVPKWVINRTNRQSIPDVFEALRKAVQLPRYRDAPVPLQEEGEDEAPGSAPAEP